MKDIRMLFSLPFEGILLLKQEKRAEVVFLTIFPPSLTTVATCHEVYSLKVSLLMLCFWCS